jgi:hypothetical protein
MTCQLIANARWITGKQNLFYLYSQPSYHFQEPTLDLLEIEEEREMRREKTARLLHSIVDFLGRQNNREGQPEVRCRRA